MSYTHQPRCRLLPVQTQVISVLLAITTFPVLTISRSLLTNIDNALDDSHHAFIGAPEVGRLTYLQLGADF